MTPVELVSEIYAGFDAGDPSVALAHCTEETTIEQDPRLPWGGRYVGRDGVLEFLARLVATLDTRIVIESMFVAGDDIVEVGRSVGTVRATGEPIDVAECHVWTIHEGLISAARFYIDSDSALLALG